jgi:hypothetical protein
MTALSELSGAMHEDIPLLAREAEAPKAFPFAGNAAVEFLQPPGGGLESGWHQTYGVAWQPAGKQPPKEGTYSGFLTHTEALWTESRKKLMDDVQGLRKLYAFRNEDAVIRFCSAHGATTTFLANAAQELTRAFGQDAILNLECVVEEDESASLYAIVVWRGDAAEAEAQLEDFDERWWLNQDAQPGLTFTYELA